MSEVPDVEALPLHRIIGGMPDADARATFTATVIAYDYEMVGLCYLITGSRETAREAAQSAWLKYWSSPPELRDPSKLRSWLLSVAANEARQEVRRSRPTVPIDDLSVAGEDSDSATNAALAQALMTLATDERHLVGLRYLIGLNSREIGDHLGISAGAVRVRLHRILGKLREQLRDE